jgi:1-acyl-sn-glycerol-3-phosphate acyltransferase
MTDPPVDPRSLIPPPTLRDKLVSVGLWGAGLAWLVPMLSSMTVLNATVGPDRIEPLSRLYTRTQIALTGSRWRAVVHPDVDPRAQYLFAQNHTNHFDHVLLYGATPHFKQGVELESHFRYPFYGWFMKARGTIPVRPGVAGRTPELLARFREEIARGHSILGFPEGTRTVDGRVGRFRTGLFFIARDLGLPVVPVAVTGAFEMMRKGSYLIRPGHEITVHVEAPIPTRGASDAEVQAIAERARAVVAARVDAYWAERAARRASGAGDPRRARRWSAST